MKAIVPSLSFSILLLFNPFHLMLHFIHQVSRCEGYASSPKWKPVSLWQTNDKYKILTRTFHLFPQQHEHALSSGQVCGASELLAKHLLFLVHHNKSTTFCLWKYKAQTRAVAFTALHLVYEMEYSSTSCFMPFALRTCAYPPFWELSLKGGFGKTTQLRPTASAPPPTIPPSGEQQLAWCRISATTS